MVMTMTGPLVARVAGQASRRGLILRVPSSDSLLADAETWLTAKYPDAIRAIHQRSVESGVGELAVSLYPAAPELGMTASDTGRVTVVASTQDIGPGYHRFIARILERMGADLSIGWDRPEADGDTGDGQPAVTFLERTATERAYLGWLGRTLVTARSQRLAGGSGVQVGIPDGTRYTFDGAIATVLGPRDDMWLERAVADTRIATDVTPWWADAADGQYLLNRALCLMWLEVRWRTPAGDTERQLLDEVHRLLSKAFPLDPTLSYPWRAWAELIGLRRIDDPIAQQVFARAARAPQDVAPIGYRRAPVTIRHEGWGLEIPGAFAERRTAEEWWGGGAGRNITIAAVSSGDMSARAFVEQFGGDLGLDAIEHRAGGVVGRAKLSTDGSSGVEVGVLDGYSAVVGSGAAIRIVFDDPGDYQWALDTWRSLRPV